MTKKHIYVIYTGGTIGMQPSAHGYRPTPGFLAQQMAQMPELHHEQMPHYTIHEYADLIDSANAHPNHWNQIAEDIFTHYDEYDGFVILHGTDTMAYTASALSFMLENLSKPVIITGSQLPIAELRNDARETLITTLMLANHCAIPEVCLYFHHQLFRGNRSRKLDAAGFAAFGSPNFSALATVGVNVISHENLWLKKSVRKKLSLQKINPTNIVSLRLFPGFNWEILAAILKTDLQALIIETFGAGNAPNDQPLLLELLREANKRGVIIVNCTQCVRGAVDMQQYATGRALEGIGVISAGNMTPETTITKLFYLLSNQLPATEVKKLLRENLRGEIG